MDSAVPGAIVIDIRERGAYDRGHVRGSFSFPWTHIDQEACGLPARSCGALQIIAPDHDEPTETDILAYFERLGFSEVSVHYLDDTNVASSDSALWTCSPTRGFCWSPNPFLSDHIDWVERHLGQRAGVVLDVGSGSGRDLVFLASRGWAAIGIENRLKLVAQANRLASKHGVSGQVCNLHADVSSSVNNGFCLRPGCIDLLNICRFIHRPSLFALIRLVRPGGVVLYSHFLEGCEATPVGRPKSVSGFFLRGELELLLTSAGLRLEVCEEQALPDGRPTINIVAVKC